MESSNGSGGDTKPQNHQPEKKRVNRAPSPARPFLKDVHSRATKPPAIAPKSPKLNKQQQQPASLPLAHPNRNSRRNTAASKEKVAAAAKSNAKSAAKKPGKVAHPGAAELKAPPSKPDSTSSPVLKIKKGKPASLSPGAPGHGSPIRVPTGALLARVSQTDSSSDLSDCPSEPLSDEQRLALAASSDAESGTGSSDRDHPAAEHPLRAEAPGAAAEAPNGAKAGRLQAQPAPGPHGGKHKQEKVPIMAQYRLQGNHKDELLREVDDLRSENDYLKVRWSLFTGLCQSTASLIVHYNGEVSPVTLRPLCPLEPFGTSLPGLTF